MATVLDREMYTEASAARLLGVAPATLHYWLEGGRKNGRTYKPVIREKASGRNAVTWAESSSGPSPAVPQRSPDPYGRDSSVHHQAAGRAWHSLSARP